MIKKSCHGCVQNPIATFNQPIKAKKLLLSNWLVKCYVTSRIKFANAPHFEEEDTPQSA